MTEKPLKELRAPPRRRGYPTRGSVTANKKMAKQSGDREATQGATRSPKKLSHPRLSDGEQEVGQAGPGDREATQGATRSPKKRLSHSRLSDSEQEVGQAEPGDREATQGATRLPKKKRLLNNCGDNRQETGQSKGSQTKTRPVRNVNSPRERKGDNSTNRWMFTVSVAKEILSVRHSRI